MNRELWDALVFDAYDHPTPDRSNQGGMSSLPLDERRTLVMTGDQAISLNICIQSVDESQTGRRLEDFHDPAWWRTHISRFSGVPPVPAVRVDTCTGEPQSGWVHVREDTAGELSGGALAGAASWRRRDPHGIRAEWVKSEIVWHPENALQASDAVIERTLAHELGHVLGFWHVPPGSEFVMEDTNALRGSATESDLGHWAYLLAGRTCSTRGSCVTLLPCRRCRYSDCCCAVGCWWRGGSVWDNAYTKTPRWQPGRTTKPTRQRRRRMPDSITETLSDHDIERVVSALQRLHGASQDSHAAPRTQGADPARVLSRGSDQSVSPQ